MKLLRFEINGLEQLGVLKGDRVFLLNDFALNKNYDSFTDFIANHSHEDLKELSCEIVDDSYSINRVNLLSPFEKTTHDILCVGLNYAEHIEEAEKMKLDSRAENAIYFSKRAEIISGSNQAIYLDEELDNKMDYETELAIIIGKKGKNISVEEAIDYIFGFTIVNDFSARELQKKHGQWFKGKSLDGYTSIGPMIVTKDEFTFPLNLDIKTTVNDEIRQSSNTQYMIRDVANLIHELSLGLTLVPGDIIATGTPSGVGAGLNPAKFLKKGDKVISEISGIGKLINIIK